jgi:hypothetical protein
MISIQLLLKMQIPFIQQTIYMFKKTSAVSSQINRPKNNILYPNSICRYHEVVMVLWRVRLIFKVVCQIKIHWPYWTMGTDFTKGSPYGFFWPKMSKTMIPTLWFKNRNLNWLFRKWIKLSKWFLTRFRNNSNHFRQLYPFSEKSI